MGRVRRMLVSTVDCGVHRHRPVDVSGGIGVGQDARQHSLPGAVGGVAALTLPHCLPRAEVVGQVPPGNTGPEPVDDSFDEPAVVTERSALSTV